MSKLRVGVVGLGNICRSEHIPPLMANKNVEIVAICDILPTKIEEMTKRVGSSVTTYLDYKQMVDKEKLDLVHICTPNYLHSQIAVYCLNKGINVFCEKPDAISVSEAVKMQEAEIAGGAKLMVMRNNRHLTSSQELKKRILSGEFGEMYTGRCGWIRRRGIPGKGGWFTTKEQSGGGPLIDLGVHMIDLAIYLMGNPRPISVSGSTYQKFANNYEASDSKHATFGEAKADGIIDVEDLAIGFIKFDNGASLQIEFSWASNVEKEVNFVELRGTKKGFSWKEGFYNVFDGTARSKFSMAREVAKQAVKYRSGHTANINHFIDVLVSGATPDFTEQQGVNMIKILEGIYTSAATGREVLFD